MHSSGRSCPWPTMPGSDSPPSLYDDVTRELTDRFGGVTAYTRSPAEGRWQSGTSEHHDDVLVVEVMVEKLDPTWWSKFRQKLAAPSGRSRWSTAPRPSSFFEGRRQVRNAFRWPLTGPQ